jgi:hypothetical protein
VVLGRALDRGDRRVVAERDPSPRVPTTRLTRRRLAGLVAGCALLSACVSNVPARPSASPQATAVTSGPTGTPPPAKTGLGSAQAALERLCKQPPLPAPSKGPAEGPTPPAIAAVEQAVEKIRQLKFVHPVIPRAVTHAKLAEGLHRSFEQSFPTALYRRRSLAWQTIGVIPQGTSIKQALSRFLSTQVIGYYDPTSGRLVFIGVTHPTPFQRVTLAHELTHALDDQHYDLTRLNRLSAQCKDEQSSAATAVVEGNATYVMLQYAKDDLSPEDQVKFALETGSSGASTTGMPPFIVAEEEWPYTAGLAFISSLVARGGETAVDHALEHFPVSTEQIIDPSKYPSDLPIPVDVRDLGPKLGAGWKDLDVQDVGEEWLLHLLQLRLDASTSSTASSGWGGGIYRASTDGVGHVAVVMATVWDTATDASQFADAMKSWIAAGTGQSAEVEPVTGSRVDVLFASDARTLASLKATA